MKRLLLLVLLFTTFVTYAQHKPYQFGFRGGVGVGWFATDAEGYDNNGAKLSGSWGFVADIYLMENYSFTTGFDVVYLNSSITTPPDEENGQIVRDIKTRYVEIPLLFTMKTKQFNEKFRIYGQVGIGAGILLSAKTIDQYTTNDGENKTDKKNVYNEMTIPRLSLILGAGVEIPIHGTTVGRFGFKFDNCFINVLKGDEAKARNNFFELNFAVLF